MLDLSRLENVKQRDGITRAACPACRAAGSDKSGNHLRIDSEDGAGKYGCAANQGDAGHRKEIFSLVGILEDKGFTKAPKRAPRPTPQPFKLIPTDREKIDVAKRAFTDAFWSGNTIVDDIAKSIGISREALRWGSWGTSGLGIAQGWLCYVYPQGVKWRNPDPKARPRFIWLAGKATNPWRSEWIKPETKTIYLTEGESDCLALIATGIEADGTAVCIASPGTSFVAEWAPLFKGKRVVICFDHDEAGRKAASKVASILKVHASKIQMWKGVSKNV